MVKTQPNPNLLEILSKISQGWGSHMAANALVNAKSKYMLKIIRDNGIEYIEKDSDLIPLLQEELKLLQSLPTS